MNSHSNWWTNVALPVTFVQTLVRNLSVCLMCVCISMPSWNTCDAGAVTQISVGMLLQGRLPVRPVAGQAAPPAPIMVKYYAKGYGKTQIGKLVILTEDQQFTYVIRGEQPTYLPPDKTQMSIHFDNQIDPGMDARLQSPASRVAKSFLVRNMMATRSGKQSR